MRYGANVDIKNKDLKTPLEVTADLMNVSKAKKAQLRHGVHIAMLEAHDVDEKLVHAERIEGGGVEKLPGKTASKKKSAADGCAAAANRAGAAVSKVAAPRAKRSRTDERAESRLIDVIDLAVDDEDGGQLKAKTIKLERAESTSSGSPSSLSGVPEKYLTSFAYLTKPSHWQDRDAMKKELDRLGLETAVELGECDRQQLSKLAGFLKPLNGDVFRKKYFFPREE